MLTMNNEEYLPKEKAIYKAVLELFEEGADINSLTVAEITGRAGIGKGTAYEYFSGKEEMIAKAFFYNGELFCRQLYEGVCKEKNLSDKVNFVLLEMENQVARMDCIFRLLHMLSENSSVSKWIRELLKQKKLSEEVPVAGLIRQILYDELGGRKVPSEENMTYLVFSIYSRVFCYGMMMKAEIYKKREQRETARRLTSQGICREVEEILAMPDQLKPDASDKISG